ncbi:MAG: GC-type dockerin domain-anchored protein [Phycisphaerales bacterium JB064]
MFYVSKLTAATALLVTAGLAASAMGQCSIYRLNMPDFDQRRSALPGDGSMYCVPTATANALAYMANNGYPGVFDGPRNWQSQSNYNFVSTQLTTLGTLMGTSVSGGTGMDGWLFGAKVYTNQAPFTIVGSYLAKGFQGVSPHQMVDQMRIGAIVMPVIGWYDPQGSGRWLRDGGHMVTMWGALNTCGTPQDTLMVFCDPWTSDSLGLQSNFLLNFSAFETNPTWTFRRKNESLYYPRKVMRVNVNDGFLDGFGVIWPVHGLTTDPATQDISFLIPKPPQDDPGPKRFRMRPIPTGSKLIAMGTGALPTEGFVLTEPEVGRVGMLHHAHFLDDTLTDIAPITSPMGMVVGRDGDAFVATPGALLRFAMQADGTYGLDDTVLLPAVPDAMHYDDAADEIIILSMAERRLIRVSNKLEIIRNDAIPAAVALLGDGSVTVNPIDGKEWIACTGSPQLARLGRDAASGRLELEEQIAMPGVTAPASVQFGDDGTVYVGEGGLVKAFKPGPRTAWVPNPDSPMDGLASGPLFTIGRGRTNYDAATMEDVNIVPSQVAPGEEPCRADLDFDGELTIFDFLAFQNLFDGGSTWADFDYDGALTIFDFLAFQNAFDSGC